MSEAKLYIKQIKPYIRPPQLQGFNDKPYPVKGYDWVSEDREEELRKEIVVSDPWSTLYFCNRFVDVSEQVIDLPMSIEDACNILSFWKCDISSRDDSELDYNDYELLNALDTAMNVLAKWRKQ